MAMIPITGPSITQREVAMVAEACEHGWYENAGLYPARFEAAFGAYVGRAHALAMPSCTSSIHLALLGWVLTQGHWVDRLAAAALFCVSLVGLAIMLDVQAEMIGWQIMPGDPALAMTVIYGAWSPTVIPLLGLAALSLVAHRAMRDPTWCP